MNVLLSERLPVIIGLLLDVTVAISRADNDLSETQGAAFNGLAAMIKSGPWNPDLIGTVGRE